MANIDSFVRAAVVILSIGLAGASPARGTIRLIVPNAPIAVPGERDLSSIIDDYNRNHAGKDAATVQLVRRGDNFSSIKELIALYLAGDPPEIAAIESSELPALQRTRLAKPIPPALSKALELKTPSSEPLLSLPFQRSVPVLVADQEVLYRLQADQGPLPRSWDGLVGLANKVLASAPDKPPLALPLQGPRGLWVFEALAGRPLWHREPGGLKSNRELGPAIEALQSLLAPNAKALAVPEMTWDRAIQDFLDRKFPLLVTTLDALPLISSKAAFRWKCGPLPTIGHAAPLQMAGGADLIVTQDSPEVWNFLQYLYSKEISARWVPSGGYLPLVKDWQSTSGWKGSHEAYRTLAQSAAAAAPTARLARSTDSDVVRAHTEWISALHYLFGDASKRLPTESVFTQLDSTLAP